MNKRRAQGPPTELEMREGIEPEPVGLVENTPEEKPFHDRNPIEENYQNFINASESAVEIPEDEPEVVPVEPVKETPPEIEAAPPVEELPVIPEPETKTPVSRFKDLSEAEAEIEKTEERRKNAERKMHETTQEAAELKRQMKIIMDGLQQVQQTKVAPEVKKEASILDLPPEELSTAILERPQDVLNALEARAEEKAVTRAIKTIEERVKKGTEQQAAQTIEARMKESDEYFEETYPDMKPVEQIIGMVGAQILSTPEGYQTLLKDPKGFVDAAVGQMRKMLNPFIPGNGNGEPKTTTTKIETPPVVVTGERREKLIASPVVKPSISGSSGKEEEVGETVQQYLNSRIQQHDRITSGR